MWPVRKRETLCWVRDLCGVVPVRVRVWLAKRHWPYWITIDSYMLSCVTLVQIRIPVVVYCIVHCELIDCMCVADNKVSEPLFRTCDSPLCYGAGGCN